jgi:hypothetical protein
MLAAARLVMLLAAGPALPAGAQEPEGIPIDGRDLGIVIQVPAPAAAAAQPAESGAAQTATPAQPTAQPAATAPAPGGASAPAAQPATTQPPPNPQTAAAPSSEAPPAEAGTPPVAAQPPAAPQPAPEPAPQPAPAATSAAAGRAAGIADQWSRTQPGPDGVSPSVPMFAPLVEPPAPGAPAGSAEPPRTPADDVMRGRVTYMPLINSSFDAQDVIDEHPAGSSFDYHDRIDYHPVP